MVSWKFGEFLQALKHVKGNEFEDNVSILIGPDIGMPKALHYVDNLPCNNREDLHEPRALYAEKGRRKKQSIAQIRKRLTLYDKIPSNGLYIFSGIVVKSDGRETRLTLSLEPPQSLPREIMKRNDRHLHGSIIDYIPEIGRLNPNHITNSKYVMIDETASNLLLELVGGYPETMITRPKMVIRDVEKWELSLLIAALKLAGGDSDSPKISLYMNPMNTIDDIFFGRLQDIMMQAQSALEVHYDMENKKSRNQPVHAYYVDTLNHFCEVRNQVSMYNYCPQNSLVLFCGTITTKSGEQRFLMLDFEPPEAMDLTYCTFSDDFIVSPLEDLLVDGKERYVYIEKEASEILTQLMEFETSRSLDQELSSLATIKI